MTVISLAQSNIIRSRSSAFKEEINQKRKVRKILAIILIFGVLFVFILNILQANSITAKDYKIRDLKQRITQLEDKNRALQVNISNLKSISILESKIEAYDMTKAQNIEYVIISPTNVATRP